MINEYFILISPKGSLKQYVIDLKHWYKSNFGDAYRLGSMPHISMASFLMNQEGEGSLKMELKRFTDRKTSFKSKTMGINAFAGNRLISLAVDGKHLNPLQWEMIQILKKLVKAPGKYLRKLRYPHFTIAHSASNSGFKKVKEVLDRNEHGSMSFDVDEITILRKPAGSNAAFEVIETYSLN